MDKNELANMTGDTYKSQDDLRATDVGSYPADVARPTGVTNSRDKKTKMRPDWLSAKRK